MEPPVEILLVEDNPGDARLVLEALNETGIRNSLKVVEDGAEAMAYLNREGDYAGARSPSLILLDLNLPKRDGRDVLAAIKRDHGLRRIPVVVLTSSRAEQDVRTSYDLHANCFVTKPVGLEEFLSTVGSIARFWLGVAALPARA